MDEGKCPEHSKLSAHIFFMKKPICTHQNDFVDELQQLRPSLAMVRNQTFFWD